MTRRVYVSLATLTTGILATPMKKLVNGDYAAMLDLKPGAEYQFRYLINGTQWENDWAADKYVTSPYGDCDNSVVITVN